MSLKTLLFPDPPRKLGWGREAQILLRTVHVVTMAVLVGAVVLGAKPPALGVWLALVTASGVGLLAVELYRGLSFLYLGAGVAMVVKLALLAVAHALPGLKAELYLAATAVASVGSHMSWSWRHFSVVHWKVQGKRRP